MLVHDDIHILEQDLEDHSNNNLCEIDREMIIAIQCLYIIHVKNLIYCAIAAMPRWVCTTIANVLRDRSGVSVVSVKISRVGPYTGLDPLIDCL